MYIANLLTNTRRPPQLISAAKKIGPKLPVDLCLPPSFNQLGGIVDDLLMMSEEPFCIAADEIELMAGALLVVVPISLTECASASLDKKFVVDLRLRHCTI